MTWVQDVDNIRLDFTESVHEQQWYMSLVTRKPVFGVSDKGRLKPACSATETS